MYVSRTYKAFVSDVTSACSAALLGGLQRLSFGTLALRILHSRVRSLNPRLIPFKAANKLRTPDRTNRILDSRMVDGEWHSRSFGSKLPTHTSLQPNKHAAGKLHMTAQVP